MKNQLINLSLLNGGTPLSEKTLTNLNLYLRNKYQTAGSSSGTTAATGSPAENPGVVKTIQDWISYFDSGRTGVDVSVLKKFTTDLAREVDSLKTQVRQLNHTEITNFLATIQQLNNRIEGIETDNEEIGGSIRIIDGQITTIYNDFDAYKQELQQQRDALIQQLNENFEQISREFSEAISQNTNQIQEQLDRVKAQTDLSDPNSEYSKKFAEYNRKQEQLDQQIQEKQDLIEGLTTNIGELSKQVQKNITYIKKNLKQHQELSKKITNTNVQVQQRTDALKKEIRNKYKYLERRINDDKKELQEELGRQNDANEKKIEIINEAIDKINQQIRAGKTELQEQKTQLEGQLLQLKASHEQLESSLNQQIAYLYYQLNGVLRERDNYYNSLLFNHNQRILILEELGKTLDTKIDTNRRELTDELKSGLQRQKETIDEKDRRLREIIQQNLDQEKRERDALQGDINVLKSQITEEVRRAQAAEKDLSDRIQSEARQALAAEKELYEMIKKEISEAKAAEKNLSDKINANKAEESRLRQQMEKDLVQYIKFIGRNVFYDARDYAKAYTDQELVSLNQAIMERESELTSISESINDNLQGFINFQIKQNAILDERINETTDEINNLWIRIDQALRNLDAKIDEETRRAMAAEEREKQKRIKVTQEEARTRSKEIKKERKRAKDAEDKETRRAMTAEKKEIQKRINVTQDEAKVRKQQISKVKTKIFETKKDLTSSIDELTSTVETIEAKFESQSVINQQMVDVLRQLNSENLENQEKLRKLKKTPFGAFI